MHPFVCAGREREPRRGAKPPRSFLIPISNSPILVDSPAHRGEPKAAGKRIENAVNSAATFVCIGSRTLSELQ